ncbi:hypothetical protein ESCO_003341 [Escovopsis weberi]|uniref:Transglycosylase SLT domain-containing protein n=1 Tax=Escovopsis weberi TaxID=150374 RepID=A0A0M9VSH1_ESCWE|nr:hypothetical protein ESCO_003341 [Escovopsis weberi]
MFAKLLLAALSLTSLAAAAPGVRFVKRNGTIADRYINYRGDGSTGAGWPSIDQWGSFDQLWAANVPLMQKSCGWNGWGADDSDAEISSINTAIQQVAGETGVDSRFILAVMMQESKGCVRVITTNNGVVNPGLMQSHDGSGTCVGVNPCPQAQITQMIHDGVAGTSSGAGLQQLAQQAASNTGGGAQTLYAAARLYNSGSANYQDLDLGLGSTACYASDVANRLMGWTLATTQCA